MKSRSSLSCPRYRISLFVHWPPSCFSSPCFQISCFQTSPCPTHTAALPSPPQPGVPCPTEAPPHQQAPFSAPHFEGARPSDASSPCSQARCQQSLFSALSPQPSASRATSAHPAALACFGVSPGALTTRVAPDDWSQEPLPPRSAVGPGREAWPGPAVGSTLPAIVGSDVPQMSESRLSAFGGALPKDTAGGIADRTCCGQLARRRRAFWAQNLMTNGVRFLRKCCARTAPALRPRR